MSAGDVRQAREYVSRMRERGRTDEEIRRRMLQQGWREEQVARLFDAPTATPRPRRPARPPDISDAAKAGIIVTAVLVPLAGFIWGLVYLVSGHVARVRWGAWALGISLAVGIGQIVLAAAMLSSGGAVPRLAVGGEGAKTVCQGNLKDLAIGVMMYCQDYDERMPDAARWKQTLRPYCARDEATYKAMLECPAGGTYAMNPQLSCRTLREIFAMGSPAQITLFYEVDDRGNPLRDVHDGGANYAYADGHVSWREAPQ